MKKNKLTKEEQRIERDLEAGLYVPISEKDHRRLELAIEKARKERSISLRLSEQDLWGIKQLALAEGMPYQTLITSILHKYTRRRLVDADSVKQVKELLRRK